jgi:hypothetical protein
VALFQGIGDVRAADAYLPPAFMALPGNLWLNRERPFPPVRGWIAQQIIKLSAVATSATNVVLLVDSDVVFVRPFDASTFWRNGAARFYRAENAVDTRLPRHMQWHSVARRLLGLPPTRRAVLPDYICWPMAWDTDIVRKMLQRVEQVSGLSWATAIASELHFSEGILYGVYVDEVLGGSPFTVSTMLSLAHTKEYAFDQVAARAFIAGLHAEDIAIMISAKSGTELSIRRQAIAAISEQAA